jgi:hypothetical protein
MFVTTAIGLAWNQFGMNRRLMFDGNSNVTVRAIDDGSSGGKTSSSVHREGSKLVMNYEIRAEYAGPYCNLVFELGGPPEGVDLSAFDKVAVQMNSRGPKANSKYGSSCSISIQPIPIQRNPRRQRCKNLSMGPLPPPLVRQLRSLGSDRRRRLGRRDQTRGRSHVPGEVECRDRIELNVGGQHYVSPPSLDAEISDFELSDSVSHFDDSRWG